MNSADIHSKKLGNVSNRKNSNLGDTLAGQSEFETLVYLAPQNIQSYFVEGSADHDQSSDGVNFAEDLLCYIKSHCRLCRLAAHFLLKILGSQFCSITIQYH